MSFLHVIRLIFLVRGRHFKFYNFHFFDSIFATEIGVKNIQMLKYWLLNRTFTQFHNNNRWFLSSANDQHSANSLFRLKFFSIRKTQVLCRHSLLLDSLSFSNIGSKLNVSGAWYGCIVHSLMKYTTISTVNQFGVSTT